MPKRKEFSRSKDKGSRQVKLEESADDVLESGVKFEEAAEKWRGGDKVKSARFFGKALHVYEAGLERFPTSKDLLYNRYDPLWTRSRLSKNAQENPIGRDSNSICRSRTNS